MTGTLGFRYNIKEVVFTNVFCYPMPGQLCIVLMKMHLLKFAAPGLTMRWYTCTLNGRIELKSYGCFREN